MVHIRVITCAQKKVIFLMKKFFIFKRNCLRNYLVFCIKSKTDTKDTQKRRKRHDSGDLLISLIVAIHLLNLAW